MAKLSQANFVREFAPDHFPSEHGPWISIHAHDPPFTMAQLKSMERQGMLQFDAYEQHYRLTLKATKLAVDCVLSGSATHRP